MTQHGFDSGVARASVQSCADETAIAVNSQAGHSEDDLVLLRNLYLTSSNIQILLDSQRTLVSVNHAAAAALGYAREELTGKSLADLLWTETAGGLLQLLDQLQADGARSELRARCTCGLKSKTGELVRVDNVVAATVMRSNDEAVIAIWAELAGGQGSVPAEADQTEAQYRELFETSTDIVFSIDRDGYVLRLNRAGERHFGFLRKPDERLNMALFIAPGQRDWARELLARRIAGEKLGVQELEVLLENGETLTVEVNAYVRMEDGQPVGVQGILRDVTVRKLALDELRRSQERFATAFDAGPVVMLITTRADGRVLDVNNCAARFNGSSRAYLSGRNMLDLGHWSRPKDLTLFQDILAHDGKLRELETEITDARGATCVMLVSADLIQLNGEECVLWTLSDISERKRSEDALRESEERYRAFLQTSWEAIWRVELEKPVSIYLTLDEQIDWIYQYGRLAECNDTMAAMYGYEVASDLQGTRLTDMLPRSNPANIEYLRAFIKSGYRLTEAESQEVDADGHVKYFLNNLVGVLENGEIARAWGTQRDITDRKLTVSLIQCEHKVLELIATGAPLPAVLDQLILLVEQHVPELKGSVLLMDHAGGTLRHGAAPSLPEEYCKLVDGFPVGPVAASCGTAAFRKQAVVVEDILTDPLWDPYKWVYEVYGLRACWSTPIMSTNGSVLGTFALYASIPYAPGEAEHNLLRVATRLAGIAIERIEAEAALRESEERYRSVAETATDAIITLDAENTISFANRAAGNIFGYEPGELTGKQLEILIPEYASVTQRSAAKSWRKAELSTVSWLPREMIGQHRDGAAIPIETSFGESIKHGKRVFTAIIRDISERRQAERALQDSEERLRQAQKMEAIGRLAGGVAHDFNNILTGIIGYSDMAVDLLHKSDPLQYNLSEIRKAAERAAELTHQLLAYSRRQILQPTPLDINSVVANLDKLLRRLIGEDVRLETSLQTGVGQIRADRGQLEQVLMNLALNARDAMPKGGRLLIETANVELDQNCVPDDGVLVPGNYVRLSVSDSGHGMNDEVRAQIFEPFFTTKEIGKGTGLGLATVYGIVKQSGGNIIVESILNEGTTFTIFLPREGVIIAQDPDAGVGERAPVGSETVLLVEDDHTVRTLTREVLQMTGYNVLDAASGAEAFALCAAYEAQIHLLLTDVVMPEESGHDLAERLCKVRPDIKVLYMSGYTDDAILRHGVSHEGIAFLQKPFSPDKLARIVRDVLDS